MRQVETTLVITATLAANLPVNMKSFANMQLDPALAAVTQLTVPVDEAWVIDDLFVSASQTPDCILEFFKNLTESMNRTSPINACIVTNVARPIPSPMVYEGASIITIVVQNLAAIGTAAATITVYVKMKKFTPH